MAQVSIREYDAKKLFAQFLQSSYAGVLVEGEPDWQDFHPDPDSLFVIKPDQLFGKRGKYGLVGVRLNETHLFEWYKSHKNKEITIGNLQGKLTTFLIEPFVPHDREYYVALKTERDRDILYFSSLGGVEVEENWESIETLEIPLFPSLSSEEKNELFRLKFSHIPNGIIDFLYNFYKFFTLYGFSYLEVNPFTFDTNGNIVCLDMVARIDNTEFFKQKNTWNNLHFVNPFGVEKTEREEYIERLDSQTGASLKFRILNPDGNIWLLTSGGGASVIIADTLADRGLASSLGNYGECSGNPDRENTKAYTIALLDSLLESPRRKQYLVIAGAIANFTHIDKTFSGIIDALEERIEELREKDLHILVRRGGINDVQGLELIKKATEKLGLQCEIAGGNEYMTDILSHIEA